MFTNSAASQLDTMKQAYSSINPPVNRNLPPVIFLHALADCRRSWKKTVPDIVKNTGRKAYLLDARNHGESSRADKMDYDVLTQDVVDFMNELDIKKAIVVGHSMGGRTAINLALKHPDKVDSLVVEDMTPQNVPSGPNSFTTFLLREINSCLKSIPPETDEYSGKKMFLDVLLPVVAALNYIDADKVLNNYDLDMLPMQKIGNAFRMDVDLEVVGEMMSSDHLVQNLPESDFRYNGEALFLYGSKAFFKLDKDPSIKKLFPRAVLKKIDGASHMLHLDSPAEFIETVSDFILCENTPSSKI